MNVLVVDLESTCDYGLMQNIRNDAFPKLYNTKNKGSIQLDRSIKKKENFTIIS